MAGHLPGTAQALGRSWRRTGGVETATAGFESEETVLGVEKQDETDNESLKSEKTPDLGI